MSFFDWLPFDLDFLESKSDYLTNDDDLVNAVNYVYGVMCWNSERQTINKCSVDRDRIWGIVLGYIKFFVDNEDQKLKYYYDEYSDRFDAYRVNLVDAITSLQIINPDNSFTNKVLSTLYWGIKRGRVNRYILKPREVLKFKDPEFPKKSNIITLLSKALESIVNLLKSAIDAASEIIKTVGSTVKTTANLASYTLRALPYVALAVGGGYCYFQYKKLKLLNVDILNKTAILKTIKGEKNVTK